MEKKEYYTLKEICELFNMNIQTARIHCRKGELKVSKIGRCYICTAEDLRAFVEARKIKK